MSLGQGPKIVTNGLVFAYDMGPNPGVNKSWKGAPTTNIFSAGRNTDNSASLFTYYFGTGASGTIGSEYQGKGITAKTATITASTNSYTNFQVYMGNVSLTGGSTYTVSAMVWTNVAFTCRIGAIQNGGSYTAYVPLNQVSLSSGWNFIFSVGTYATTVTDARFQLDFGTAPVGTTIKVMKPQIEQSNYATPYVNGTRSNTEVLLDWAGNNTITADSLIYDNDGTFRFDGTTQDNRCTITPSTELSSLRGTTDITVEAWVNYSSYSGGTESYSVITCWGAPWVWLLENPSNRLRFRITAGGADVNIADTSNHTLNTWIQVVGTYDGATKKIYINGVLKNSSAQTGVLGSPGGTPKIGTYQGTDYCMSGQIGVTRIYNRALTANEVAQNFNAHRTRYGI